MELEIFRGEFAMNFFGEISRLKEPFPQHSKNISIRIETV